MRNYANCIVSCCREGCDDFDTRVRATCGSIHEDCGRLSLVCYSHYFRPHASHLFLRPCWIVWCLKGHIPSRSLHCSNRVKPKVAGQSHAKSHVATTSRLKEGPIKAVQWQSPPRGQGGFTLKPQTRLTPSGSSTKGLTNSHDEGLPLFAVREGAPEEGQKLPLHGPPQVHPGFGAVVERFRVGLQPLAQLGPAAPAAKEALRASKIAR